MIRKEAILVVFIYKLITNLIRISFALFIFNFNCSISSLVDYVSSMRCFSPTGFTVHFLNSHIANASPQLTFILGFSLLFLSAIDLFFVIAFIFRKRWGAIGFFILAILWVPIELLFVSKFLLISNILTIIIDIVILVFLYRLITHPDHYFKK